MPIAGKDILYDVLKKLIAFLNHVCSHLPPRARVIALGSTKKAVVWMESLSNGSAVVLGPGVAIYDPGEGGSEVRETIRHTFCPYYRRGQRRFSNDRRKRCANCSVYPLFQARRGRGQHAYLLEDAEPRDADQADGRLRQVLRPQCLRGVHEEGERAAIY